ncbi:MAG: hypothetical protein KC502_22645 [Myxococcales bacterium]|nr:hypothetical protein [Myxococcales bacterium]
MSISRRDFMSLVGTSVAGATALAASARYAGSTAQGAQSTAHLQQWRVAAIGAVDRGAVPFTLENSQTGERIRVDACRTGSRRGPVASSSKFDLFLHNGGSGSSPTERDHQLVARSLAKRLDAERSQAPEAVLTMDARLDRHPELFQTNDDRASA